MTDQTGGETFG